MTQTEPDNAVARTSLELAIRLFETLNLHTMEVEPLMTDIIDAGETLRPTFGDNANDLEAMLAGALVNFVTLMGGGMAVLLDRTLKALPDDKYPNAQQGFEGFRDVLIQNIRENPNFEQVLAGK